MAAQHTLTDHALLSAAAAALSPEALDAHVLVAEYSLNLRDLGTATEEPHCSALAYQVNLQVELDPLHGIRTEEVRGGRRSVYNTATPISAQAVALLSGLAEWPGLPSADVAAAQSFGVITSFRPLEG